MTRASSTADRRYWPALKLLEQGARLILAIAPYGDPYGMAPICEQIRERLAEAQQKSASAMPSLEERQRGDGPSIEAKIRRALAGTEMDATQVAAVIARSEAYTVEHLRTMRAAGVVVSWPQGPKGRLMWALARTEDEAA